MKARATYLLTLVVAAPVILVGCGKPTEQATPSEPAATVASPLSELFGTVETTGALLPIPELRKSVKPGDEVVLEAKVMGAKQPFVDNRALFVVGDEATLTSCDVRPEDRCPTPWDACCDDPDTIRAGTATIQVVDESGGVLRHGIQGVAGLRELSRVRVSGVVAPGSGEAVLVINASRIQIL